MILVAASALAKLAGQHRQTIMVGRTLTRHAVPITFGLKAAGWLNGVLDALDGIVLARNGLGCSVAAPPERLRQIAELADDHGIDWSAGLAVPRSPKSASWQARGRGGSSTMPQKRDPVLAVLIRRAVATAPMLGSGRGRGSVGLPRRDTSIIDATLHRAARTGTQR